MTTIATNAANNTIEITEEATHHFAATTRVLAHLENIDGEFAVVYDCFGMKPEYIAEQAAAAEIRYTTEELALAAAYVGCVAIVALFNAAKYGEYIEYETRLAAARAAEKAAQPAVVQTATLLKTKYTRKNVKGTETFTAYALSIPNGGKETEVTFPKGVTLPQIKKLYPQLTITVAVMPSVTLKGLNKAACEEITAPMVRGEYGVKKPADIAIETATAEELAQDFKSEPDGTIYTIESERPAPLEISGDVAELCAATQAAEEADFDKATQVFADYTLADVRTWDDFKAFMACKPPHTLQRKTDGAKVVSFEEYSEKVVCITLDNGKESYPFYHVLSRYYNVVPA